MFDITSSKLLILGLVALIVIGPKDLPPLLRTLGRYMGIIKRQAAEFRAQFDEAMREAELDQLKREVETLGNAAESEMRAAEHAVTSELSAAGESVNAAIGGDGKVSGESVNAAITGDGKVSGESVNAAITGDGKVSGESVNAAITGDEKLDAPNAERPTEANEDRVEDEAVEGGEDRSPPQGAPNAAPAANGADTQGAVGEAARAREQSGA